MHFDAAREVEIEERACSAATSAFRFHRPKFGAFIAACLGRAAYERVRREQITQAAAITSMTRLERVHPVGPRCPKHGAAR